MKSLRLAEIMGALSIASDLGAGFPTETSLSSTALAVRIGRLLSLPEQELSAIYYACLLRFIGCSATAVEKAAMAMGEDAKLIYSIQMSDWSKPEEVEQSLRMVFDTPLPAAVVKSIQMAVNHVDYINTLHCGQAQILASRLPLPNESRPLLAYIYYHRWDGNRYR